jgi:hypothetical protein
MTITTQSPFGADDLTLNTDIGKIVEQFIQEKWNVSDIPSTDVKWGYRGDMILQSGKGITIRAYPYFQRKNRLALDGSRYEFIESVMIDCYFLDNNIAEINAGRDPKAIKVLKFLDSLFLINQGSHYKGIYDFKPLDGVIKPDDVKKSITHLMFRLEIRYIIDVVNI